MKKNKNAATIKLSRHSNQYVLTSLIPLADGKQFLGIITLNRPKDMNPLDWGTVKELRKALKKLAANQKVCVIAITGAGKGFSAGGDLRGYLSLYRNPTAFRSFLGDLRAALDLINNCPQPVLALVNGYCVAGGLELLLACDMAYASESAKIGDGHANFGQVGGAGSNVRLPRWIAPHRAKELLFTGQLLNAGDAMAWGLINRVVPDGKLVDAAVEFANIVAKKSPLGIRTIKRICNATAGMRLDKALDYEMQEVHQYATSSWDAYEGLNAFLEKRPPKFQGR